MKQKTMLCPSKKDVVRNVITRKGKPVAESAERFGDCAGDHCMAYKHGKCLLIEREAAT